MTERNKQEAAAAADEEESPAAMAARIQARRKQQLQNPVLCSNCLNGGDKNGAMLVETKGDLYT